MMCERRLKGDAPHAAHESNPIEQANNTTVLRSPLNKGPVPYLRDTTQTPKSLFLL
jgi:hypothetical protein